MILPYDQKCVTGLQYSVDVVVVVVVALGAAEEADSRTVMIARQSFFASLHQTACQCPCWPWSAKSS